MNSIYLATFGYRMFDIVEDEWSITEKYQRRLDTDDGFSFPLCNCNDALFINIERWEIKSNNSFSGKPSSKINLVHENAKGEWCDVGIYSISDEQLLTNIKSYEAKLLVMWDLFCKE